MSWIKDVSFELKKLDVSQKSLRKFGLTIGAVFLLFSLWCFYVDDLIILRTISVILGLFLILAGIFYPIILLRTYKLWMGIAFALGWIVSRFLLTILFLLVLTPIGIIAKLFKKKFLQISVDKKKQTYWSKHDSKNINYEKMY